MRMKRRTPSRPAPTPKTMMTITNLAAAGVAQAIDAHVLPGYARFAEQTARLAETAEATCEADALKRAPFWPQAPQEGGVIGS